MARTAVVNPKRRKRRRKRNPSRSSAPRRRRRRNYGAAAEVNPRRRRRGKRRSAPRRRRNPDSSLGRSRNPGFDIDHLIDTVPAATGGVWAARWATKLAGPMEEGEPSLKHAIAIWIAAHFGGQMIGQLFGSSAKGEYARIGALAFGGDMFLRLRFMKESKWMKENLTLGGVDEMGDAYDVPDYSEGSDLNGFQDGTALGDSFVDAMGNQYVQTAQGWALAGMGDAQIVQGADGELYQLGSGEFVYPSNYDSIMEVSGFESGSSIGFHPASGSHASSFGYAP